LCLIDAIAGCEKYNADYFVSHGMAVTMENEEEPANFCIGLLRNNGSLSYMKAQMEKHSPGNAAKNIVDFIINGVK